MRVTCVVGVRPSIIKLAPVIRALEAQGDEVLFIHTGQHYANELSAVFIRELGLRDSDVCLHVGSATHGRQTARVIEGVEQALTRWRPDWCVVVGDTNSTLGAALAAAKLGVPLAHVEAGLRSFDRSMPEEINRMAVDAVADLHFATDADAVANLRREGKRRIELVGNTVADSLVRLLPKALASHALCDHQLLPGRYGVVTLHRPANVDDPLTMDCILHALRHVAQRLPLVWPVHPRMQFPRIPGVLCVDPLGYVDFLGLVAQAKLVLTDSGGIQEETTILGVPCLTLRKNTERPITVAEGTNRLVGSDPVIIRRAVNDVLSSTRESRCPELWDGHAGERIAEALHRRFQQRGS